MFKFWGNSITRKVEKKRKLEGDIELAKKQQKVESEKVLKEYEEKKKQIVDTIEATIVSLQAQITNLRESRKTRQALLDEEKKVELDKVINEYDQKIMKMKNEVKKLGYLIEAEQKNIADIIEPEQPNAPTSRVLTESTQSKGKK